MPAIDAEIIAGMARSYNHGLANQPYIPGFDPNHQTVVLGDG